ncbi:Regulatory protein SoxS [compost metagenome]
MNYLEYMQKTIDYIEESLKESISIHDCAQVSGFSKYHFHRLFSMFVGLPVMEYIRKRRLYHAMIDVLDGKRVIDIALDYGYSSERAFSRAFSQEFGQIPSRCRNGKYSLPSKPQLTGILNPLNGGFQMDYFSEVRIDDLETMTVASASRIGNEPEDEVIAYLTKWAEAAGIENDSRKFGFDIPVSEEEQSKGHRGYEYWISVKGITSTPSDVMIKCVEGSKYAILRITDPFLDPMERIPVGWKKLVSWVNSKGYVTSNHQERYWLEEVIEKDGITYMDLYFPID